MNTTSNTMLETSKSLGLYLDSREDVTQWQITASDQKRREIYLIGEKIEQLRGVENKEYSLVLFCDSEVSGDLKRGMATVTLSVEEAIDSALTASIVTDGVYAAGLGLNPHYTLDELNTSDSELKCCDRDAIKLPTETVENIAKRTIDASSKEEDVYLAAAEVFFTHNKRVRTNSNGLVYEDETTLYMYELVIGSAVEKDVETQCLLTERLSKNIPIEEIVAKYAGYCRDNTKAILPDSGIGNVIFADESFESLFAYFQGQVSGTSKYMKMTTSEIEDEVVPLAGEDKITMSIDPYLEGGLAAAKYDHFGTLLEKQTLIKDGVLVKHQADKRFATYLKCDVTGAATNYVVEPGTTSYEDMLEEGVLVLSRFSAFMPNPVTGDFSAEIRNGHVVKDGKLVPIKGGSISGNMKKVFRFANLSSETLHYGNYFGPKYVKVSNVTITGA